MKKNSKTNSNKTSSNSTSVHKNTTPSNLNNNNNGDGNKGGWEHSEMRIYLQTDVFNALPEELKNVVTITKVISENGPNDNTKMTTSNTLYLLSLKEVVGNGMDETRQLDYYTNNEAIKRYNETNEYCWLRSANTDANGNFYMITPLGGVYANNSGGTIGVSPAFRLG